VQFNAGFLVKCSYFLTPYKLFINFKLNTMNTTPEKKPWKTWQKVVLGIAVFIIAISFFANKSASSSNSATTAAAPAAPTAIVVDAKKLFADYASNEVAADEMYKGKQIELTGTVESINKDMMDDIYVSIGVGDFKNIHCTINKEYKSNAAQLKKGQTVTIQGEGGTMIIGTPVIDNCIIK
jgi:hypothetical protein